MRAYLFTDGGDFSRLESLLKPCGVVLENGERAVGEADLAVLDRLPTSEGTVELVERLREGGARVIALIDGAGAAHVGDLYRAGADVVFDAAVDSHHLFMQACALLRIWQPDMRPARVGKAQFDPAGRKLQVDDRTVRLTEAESKILALLVDGRSGYVSRESISQTVFKISYDRFDRRIDVHVSNLRRKLRENDIGVLIDTSRLNGFRLLGPADEHSAAAVG